MKNIKCLQNEFGLIFFYFKWSQKSSHVQTKIKTSPVLVLVWKPLVSINQLKSRLVLTNEIIPNFTVLQAATSKKSNDAILLRKLQNLSNFINTTLRKFSVFSPLSETDYKSLQLKYNIILLELLQWIIEIKLER